MLTADTTKSRVVVETRASGLFASVAHDLRIEAPVEEGTSLDGERCTLRFEVVRMKVVESCRHDTGAWHSPSPSDAGDIESRIRREVFEGLTTVSVDGRLVGDRAVLAVRARNALSLETAVRVDRDASGLRARGRCALSLRALGAGKVRVPLGAIKLEDAVTVSFDVTFVG